MPHTQNFGQAHAPVNTVRSHLTAGQKPKYERQKKRPSKLSPYEVYLRERQTSAHPLWIPATVLHREIAALGYQGGMSQLRRVLREIKPTLPPEPVVRFETAPGEQMQVDWVEFRKRRQPLYAFCATLGYSRANYVEFVADMKVGTLIDCHQKAFAALGGLPRRILYDNMKIVVLERDVDGPGERRYHAGFLDYAKHCGFVIKLCRPYRARTKGKVERFNGYLRRSFYVPLVAKLKQAGLQLDVVTANVEVRHWLKEVANVRIHGTTQRHPRSSQKDHYATLAEHMPAAHRAHAEWSPGKLQTWAASVGPSTAELVKRLLMEKKHPEQGYRSCLGLMRLTRNHGQIRLEAACERALAVGAHRYRSVASILEKGLDRQPVLPQQAELALPDHANVRGPDYYH